MCKISVKYIKICKNEFELRDSLRRLSLSHGSKSNKIKTNQTKKSSQVFVKLTCGGVRCLVAPLRITLYFYFLEAPWTSPCLNLTSASTCVPEVRTTLCFLSSSALETQHLEFLVLMVLCQRQCLFSFPFSKIACLFSRLGLQSFLYETHQCKVLDIQA